MPIEHAIWKVGKKPVQLSTTSLQSESDLENMVAQDMSILSEDWLLIGRQVRTAYNKNIDLLAIDSSGSIIIIELKRNRTPREVVAQAIDYASWVKDLEANDLANIFDGYSRGYDGEAESLDQAFQQKFNQKLEEDDINSSHQMVVVAAELDSSTERIVRYLGDHNVAINVVFFRVFKDGENRYLSRAWFIDPSETLEQATAPRGNEPWNGEYYVSFGHQMGRDWRDAFAYGFISAGGKKWNSKTMNYLSAGDRVWVNVPKSGYVGVGIATAAAVKADEYLIKTENGEVSFYQAELRSHYHQEYVDDDDKAEYIVGINWLKKLPLKEAKWEVGFFANQNSVARPTTPKWRYTVERLKVLLDID